MKKRIILKRGEEKRIIAGHPWVFDNEVKEVLDYADKPVSLEPGETADVEAFGKKYLGRAFANPKSKIVARIYSPSKEGVDKGFFKRRLREAFARRTCAFNRDSCRLVFGEADFLPGFILDRFVGWAQDEVDQAITRGTLGLPLVFEQVSSVLGEPKSWLVMQVLSYGIERRRAELVAALDETLTMGLPAGIIDRSPEKILEQEGLAAHTQEPRGTFPSSGIVIFENDVAFVLDLIGGQKTGHFLDQRENRAFTASLVQAGNRVLDAFCYTGGFALNVARAGADEVLAVDSSSVALETLQRNARLNGCAQIIKPLQSDVFEKLRELDEAKARFDMVILDPPAFAKTHTDVDAALRGYKEINLRALRLLNRGGFLVTCSCSQSLDEYRFRRMVDSAARDAEVRLHQYAFRGQASDHPVLLGYAESLYLKAGVYRVAAN